MPNSDEKVHRETDLPPGRYEDPAPGIQIGDFVQARERIEDEGLLIAEIGDVGTVILKELTPLLGWCLPTVKWERTGCVYDVTPEEVDVLAEQDFATRPETTPKKPRRVMLRRGVE